MCGTCTDLAGRWKVTALNYCLRDRGPREHGPQVCPVWHRGASAGCTVLLSAPPSALELERQTFHPDGPSLKGPFVRLCFKKGRKEVYPCDHADFMKS